MKERPILFNGEMVRAILAGQKTQTRRVVFDQRKEQPLVVHGVGTFSEVYKLCLAYKIIAGDEAQDDNQYWLHGEWATRRNPFLACPYGQPGDRLWVRETWMCDEYGRRHQSQGMVHYRADAESLGTWRPSIFMPRWASRITLEITNVQAERVQDITEADAVSEGMEPVRADLEKTAKDRFSLLWDSINEKRGCGWKSNPYVWALTFRPV